MNDLNDCLWDGLVVGANNITIDLDGHTIDGKGIGAGIRNDGYDNVTIRNGKVSEFDYGVIAQRRHQRNIVEALTLEIEPGGRRSLLGFLPQPDPILGLPLPAAAARHVPVGRSRTTPSATTRSSPTTSAIWLTNADAQNTTILDNYFGANNGDSDPGRALDNDRIERNEIRASSAAPASRSRARATTSILDNAARRRTAAASCSASPLRRRSGCRPTTTGSRATRSSRPASRVR